MTPPRSMSPSRQTGSPARRGEPHVGDVPGAQIDLRRAAGALHDHQIDLGDQPPEALHDRVHQAGTPRPVLGPMQHPHRPSVHDHLRAAVGLRLQQHRIEVRPRRQAGRSRLHRLRPPDLAPVRARRGVVRHVLRLERRHAHAPPPRRPAQPRDHQRLPRVGRRPLDHDRPPAHGRNCSPITERPTVSTRARPRLRTSAQALITITSRPQPLSTAPAIHCTQRDPNPPCATQPQQTSSPSFRLTAYTSMDAHYTPQLLAQRLIAAANDLRPPVVADLCAGRGDLLFQAETVWPHAIYAAIDIDPTLVRDLRRQRTKWHVGQCDLTNPTSRQQSAVLQKVKQADFALAIESAL